jgi:ankyrin repeat protein
MKPAKALAQAASVGDLKTMRTMMKQAPSLAVEWQPIMDVCFAGQAEAVELLLECGADPNISSKSAHHYRPLHRTVEYKKPFPKHPGHCTVVDLLLNAGADPTQRGSYWLISAIALCACGDAREFLPAMLKALPAGLDIFHASVLGEVDQVKKRLKKDPSLADAKDSGTKMWGFEDGWTPLMYCARTRIGQSSKKKADAVEQVAELLLGHGAPHDSCIDLAIMSDNLSVADVLLRVGAIISNDDTINHAACDGQFAALELLEQYNTPLDGTRGTEHHGGYTPLGCAVSSRSITGVQWFLSRGQDPNKIKSKDKENCLHVAVQYGASEKMLQLLLEHGATLNQTDRQGRTP